eukprot:gene10814-biopygen7169
MVALSEEDVELRVDANDGCEYPLSSFLEEYGDSEGRRLWAAAAPTAGSAPGGCSNFTVVTVGHGGITVRPRDWLATVPCLPAAAAAPPSGPGLPQAVGGEYGKELGIRTCRTAIPCSIMKTGEV